MIKEISTLFSCHIGSVSQKSHSELCCHLLDTALKVGQNLFGCKKNSPCKVTIKTYEGKYVSAEKNGHANANQNKKGQFEIWTATFVNENTVNFKSGFNKYLVAEKSGNVNANRGHAYAYEEFTVFDKGYGFFNFKSHHEKYLVAEPNGELNANQTDANNLETFKVERVEESGGKYTAMDICLHTITK